MTDDLGAVALLVLEDAMLAERLADMLRVLAIASYPDEPRTVKSGLPSGALAGQIAHRFAESPELFPDEFEAWLGDVDEAIETRNQLVHAVAVNRCDNCGSVPQFRHPRSGATVDRTSDAVVAVTEQLRALDDRGWQSPNRSQIS